MSRLSQLSLQQLQIEESQHRRFPGLFPDIEASLLAEIFRRNAREDEVSVATPPGYRYCKEDCVFALPAEVNGPVMQITAHPGDGPDFFYATYLKMTKHVSSLPYHEILLTDGERGVDGWPPERTRQVRIDEARAGARLVGSELHFLGYPDGGLASLAAAQHCCLVRELADMIGSIQPALLFVHPPQNDHPDHAHSFLFTLAALELNALTGGRRPELFVHDVEFGLQQRSLWGSQGMDPRLRAYPLYSPEFLVDISSTHQQAQSALARHNTQMYDPLSGQPKLYADLIDTLARVRGLQFLGADAEQFSRGQGFSQIIIPGVTSLRNNAFLSLLAGDVYRRILEEQL